MQISKQWLSTYLDGDLNKINLDEILTFAGLEVEDIQDLSSLSDLVVVGDIIEIKKHPDADRLNICKVDVGESNFLKIVCGAPNARVGIKVPCAKVGAKLENFEIKKAKLRGIESFGMLCSAKEIGLSQDSNGLLELNKSFKPGDKIIDSLKLNDIIYTLSITPNRADCLSIFGVAREVSALTSLSLKDISQKKLDKLNPVTQKVNVKNQKACPRYCGRQIKGIDNLSKIPDWIKLNLERSGINSINPVVDITNYVLLEIGQPFHAFDQEKINGTVEVRQAIKNEKLTLLSGEEINFSGQELVIADSKSPIALAGIMGGVESSVNLKTKDIFIESAYFDAVSIAGRARSFGLNTDASHRFERGVDYLNTLNALDRATSLIIEICGGEASEAIDLTYELPTRSDITLRSKKVSSIMGINIPDDEIELVLKKLSLDFKKQKDSFVIKPPSFRFDLNIEEDLIEEVIRIYGYENIPAIIPTTKAKMLSQPAFQRSKKDIKTIFANLGYNEIVSYSFIDQVSEENLHGNKDFIKLQNPIASHMNVMRSRMWASHIEALLYNLNRSQAQVRLFEIASTYIKLKDGYKENEVLSGLVYGPKNPEQWTDDDSAINFYDIKGDIESLSGHTLTFKSLKSSTPNTLHPGQTAQILIKDKPNGWLGQLHPAWQQKYEIPGIVYLFELSLEALTDVPKKKFEMPSKHLSVRRDISIIVDKEIIVGDIINCIKNSGIDRLDGFFPFDLYEGGSVKHGKKSIAFLILMKDTYKTLEENEVNNIVKQVLTVLQDKFKAELR